MNNPVHETMPLINFAKIDDVVLAFKESGHSIEIDRLFHMDLIFDFLNKDSGLLEIIKESKNQIEKCIIIQTLEYTNGNKSKAALILKINYKTLYYKIKKYCL